MRAVRKNMKHKACAAKVQWHDMLHGTDELGRLLDNVIADVVVALQDAAERLGIEGTVFR